MMLNLLVRQMNTSQLAGLIMGVLCIVPVTHAQQVYKWQDAKGAVHYTQTPPPPNAKSQTTVEVKSRTNLQPAPAAPVSSTDTAAANNKTLTNSQAQKPKMAPADCAALKNSLESLNSGRRVYESDKNGERAYITEEQRAEKISTYTKTLSESCS